MEKQLEVGDYVRVFDVGSDRFNQHGTVQAVFTETAIVRFGTGYGYAEQTMQLWQLTVDVRKGGAK